MRDKERTEAGNIACGGDNGRIPFFSRRGVVRVTWFLIGALCGGGAIGLLRMFL